MADTDIPLHHYPVNVGLTTGMEIAPNWTLALNEFRALAVESRRRRAARQQAQTQTTASTSEPISTDKQASKRATNS